MALKEKLQVKLYPGWIDYSAKNPSGPTTFINSTCKTINPLQITYALYKSGTIPNPSSDDLLKMCADFGNKN